MGERVRITEVSPRDGLQNEPGVVSAAEKVRLVELACASGVDEVEVTSFVSARWVPQLGDASEVVAGVGASGAVRGVGGEGGGGERGVVLSALVPNEKGLAALLEANGKAGRKVISKASVFTAASETFSVRNTNAAIAETIERFRPVVVGCMRAGLDVRGYLSCAVACPFEGPIAPAVVARWAAELAGLGIREIDLGDTIGAGTSETVAAMLGAVRDALARFAGVGITLHLHDTFGRGVECVRTALSMGVRSFDGSVGGLGGCPYAARPGGARAPGNIATETLVRTVHEAGYSTGVDEERLRRAGAFAREIVGRVRGGAGASGPGSGAGDGRGSA